MRKLLSGLSAAAALLAAVPSQAATIRVDLASQTMHVSSASGEYDWPISSARAGYVTPRGSYGVQRLEAMHYSHKYHNSPMPHSIFFRGGYAIHGTYATASLGAPASHGCIRIAPENAALLYGIVRQEGARIAITGTPDTGLRYARAERRRQEMQPDDPYANGQMAAPALAYSADGTPMAPSLGDWFRSPDGAVAPRHHGRRSHRYGYGYDAQGYGAPAGYVAQPVDDDN